MAGLPGVGQFDKFCLGQQPVEEVIARVLIASHQGATLAFFPAVTVGRWRSSL